jgi:hypothetical protein
MNEGINVWFLFLAKGIRDDLSNMAYGIMKRYNQVYCTVLYRTITTTTELGEPEVSNHKIDWQIMEYLDDLGLNRGWDITCDGWAFAYVIHTWLYQIGRKEGFHHETDWGAVLSSVG